AAAAGAQEAIQRAVAPVFAMLRILRRRSRGVCLSARAVEWQHGQHGATDQHGAELGEHAAPAAELRGAAHTVFGEAVEPFLDQLHCLTSWLPIPTKRARRER